MPTPKSKRNKRSRSSCPDGWRAAGYSVPIHLTVKQQRYCHRAIGITRFVYNLCVATHRFCRTNRLPWPSWQDLYKAFNACKREDYPFVTAVASRVAEGAFMDFGTAIKNWRDTDHKAGPPRSTRNVLPAPALSAPPPASPRSSTTASVVSRSRASVPSSFGTHCPRAWSTKRTSSS